MLASGIMSDRIEVGAVIDGYRIEGRLGEGGSGEVFRARRGGGPPVALKRIGDTRPGDAARTRFLREAKAMNALSHPHLVEILDFGITEEAPYLVMELLEGAPLDAVLGRGRLDAALALDVARQILAGLAYCHEHGVLHRDMKPANVHARGRAGGGMHVKLLDFGLAKFMDADRWGPQSVLTVEGTVLGTPAYMAPEQSFGEIADMRSDVYSTGVLLFELWTGVLPFEAKDRPGWVRAHALTPVPSIVPLAPDLPAVTALDAVLQKALGKRPPERYEDARALEQALRDALGAR